MAEDAKATNAGGVPQFFTKAEQPEADIILKSSDGHHFYAQKSLLAHYSPVLAGMFGSCAGGDIGGDLPIAALPDTSVMLGYMLPYFYKDCPDELHLHKSDKATTSDYKEGIRFADFYELYEVKGRTLPNKAKQWLRHGLR